MLYQYTTKENPEGIANPKVKSYYIIGLVTFVIGILYLVYIFRSGKTGSNPLIEDVIYPLVGLVCIIDAYIISKTASFYSISMDDEKIKVSSEYGKTSDVIPYKQLNKIDIQNDNIYLHHKLFLRVNIDLSLVTPEEKREELVSALEGVVRKCQMPFNF